MDAAENNWILEQTAEFGSQQADSPTLPKSQDSCRPVQAPEMEFGCYDRICATSYFDEFKQSVRNEVNNLGFSDYSFVRLEACDSLESQSLVTLPQELLDRYYEKGLYKHDAILEYAENSERPIFRSVLDKYIAQAPYVNAMTRATQAICELSKSYGYSDFYIIPVHGIGGRGRVILSIADQGCDQAEFKSKVESCKSLLLLLCESIDWATVHNFPDLFLAAENDSVVINPKPLLVLSTLANNDLNISQVADRLNISVVTANKHLETVRRSLAVRTNYAAIKKAVVKGLINYKE